MEYQQKKKQILEEVQYTNLLTFTLAENRLQRNFKSVVEALMLNQDDTQSLHEQLNQLKNKTQSDMKNMADKLAKIQERLNNQGQGQEKVNGSMATNTKIQTDANIKRESIHSNITHELQDPLEGRNSEHISQPKLNFNLVQSEQDLDDIQAKGGVNEKFDAYEKINDQRYNEIKNVLNILRHDTMQNNNLAKDVAALRDQINSLRGQVKTVSDRSQRSIKRVSLTALQTTQTARQNKQNSINPTSERSGKIHEQFQKQINNIYIQLNTLKLCVEEAKQMNAESRRKEGKLSLMIEELQKNLKKLNQKQNDDVDKINKEIKDMKMQMLVGATDTKKDIQSRKIIENPSSNKQGGNSNQTSKQLTQLADKILRIQNALTNFTTSTELTRLKSNIDQKLSSLQNQDQNIRKQLKDEIQILMELNDEKTQKIRNLQLELKSNQQQIKESGNHFQRKNNITLSKIEELKKNLQNLKEDLEFYKSMNDDNMKNQSNTANNNSNNLSVPIPDDKQQKKQKVQGKTSEQLKKYFNRKLHDQRAYLLGLIRDLQKKASSKNGCENDIVSLWDKIEEINLFLNKKSNEDDVKKHLAYMDKKISALYNRLNSTDENNDDARIAKTNWFCLSCDKNLQNYQGKIGKHIIWDSMPLKTNLTKYSIKGQDKKSLPVLKR